FTLTRPRQAFLVCSTLPSGHWRHFRNQRCVPAGKCWNSAWKSCGSPQGFLPRTTRSISENMSENLQVMELRARLISFARRQNCESSPSANTIGLEIIVIHCEDQTQGFSGGQMYQRCICEIHRTVGVVVHQRVDLG